MKCIRCWHHTDSHELELGERWGRAWPVIHCNACSSECGKLSVLMVLYLKAKLALTGKV